MALKKPKKSKYPKKPKQSATLDAWKKYDEKVKLIDSSFSKKLKEYESDKKNRDTIIKKYR